MSKFQQLTSILETLIFLDSLSKNSTAIEIIIQGSFMARKLMTFMGFFHLMLKTNISTSSLMYFDLQYVFELFILKYQKSNSTCFTTYFHITKSMTDLFPMYLLWTIKLIHHSEVEMGTRQNLIMIIRGISYLVGAWLIYSILWSSPNYGHFQLDFWVIKILLNTFMKCSKIPNKSFGQKSSVKSVGYGPTKQKLPNSTTIYPKSVHGTY